MFFSFASFIPEVGVHNKLLLAALFYVGVVFISEWITIHFAHKSLLQEIRKSWHNTFAFILTTAVGGLLLDGVAKFLGKLWIYPDWTPIFYAAIFIPGFAAYWLAICESYLAVKVLLDKITPGKRRVGKLHRYERWFYSTLGMCGVIFSLLATLLLLIDFFQQSLPLFVPDDVRVSAPSFQVAFTEVMLLFLGIWFFLEWLEYYRKKTSLIKDIVHHYYTPLIAIVLGSMITSVFMELQNVPAGLWRYTNWPLSDFAVLDMPILIFIIWPLHYITFLSLFRAMTNKESAMIWQSDRIA